MPEELKQLIEKARSVKMTAEDRERQRRSFAYGNTALENPLITREMVDAEADALKSEACREMSAEGGGQRHSKTLDEEPH